MYLFLPTLLLLFKSVITRQAKSVAIKPKARKSIHDVILNWFDQAPRGTVLDVPAGYGHLSMKLAQMGFSVTAGEIDPAIFQLQSIPCIYTDLNKTIEAPDNSFDYVCCVDGLEHMTDPYQAVKELSRVLKKGGKGVFSIPNYSNIERRLKFLIKGYFTKPLTLERYEREGANLFNFHNSILTITILDFMFRLNRLTLIDILENAKKPKQFLLFPFVAILWLINLFQSKQSKFESRTDITLKPVVILGGNNLVFIVEKH